MFNLNNSGVEKIKSKIPILKKPNQVVNGDVPWKVSTVILTHLSGAKNNKRTKYLNILTT
ncbi:MAG: hypothetical protein HC903_23025 [Methylacidiphilales bacterium]|nr:hypothetical protein [Candidatus Methylacidiphilales bacterium]NJR18448.1 hypothetical protein [Calothrix sp. CSU_2_0]